MKIQNIATRLYKTPIMKKNDLPEFNAKQNETVANSFSEQISACPYTNIINFKGNELKDNEALLFHYCDKNVKWMSEEEKNCKRKMIESLLKAGADVNEKDEYERTPLIYCVKNGDFETAEFLIENGANVNAKDKDGNTIFTEILDYINKYISKFADKNELKSFYFFLKYAENNSEYKDKLSDYKKIFMSENNIIIQELIDRVGTDAIDNDVLEEQAKNANSTFFEILKDKMLKDKKIADKYPDFETYYFTAKANKFHSIDGKFALTYPKQDDFDVAGLANYFCTRSNMRVNGSSTFRIPAKNVVTTSVELMLEIEDKKFLEKLKDFGVQAIINVARDNKKYEQKCKDAGLEYFNFSLPSLNENNWWSVAKECAKNPEFIDKLKKLFEIINSKNVIMGCQQGYFRTSLAIYLNYYLNKTQQEPTLELAHTYEKLSNNRCYSKFVKEFFNYLTETQKKELGLQDTDIDKIPAIDDPDSYKQ